MPYKSTADFDAGLAAFQAADLPTTSASQIALCGSVDLRSRADTFLASICCGLNDFAFLDGSRVPHAHAAIPFRWDTRRLSCKPEIPAKSFTITARQNDKNRRGIWTSGAAFITRIVVLIASALFNASTTPSVAGWLRIVAHRVREAAMHLIARTSRVANTIISADQRAASLRILSCVSAATCGIIVPRLRDWSRSDFGKADMPDWPNISAIAPTVSSSDEVRQGWRVNK